MRIGIISNSDCFIPLAGALIAQQQQVHLFYCASADSYINQKVDHISNQLRLPHADEASGANLYNWLTNGKFDICYIIGYPKLIDLEALKSCRTPIYNIHFGALPAYKGPTPIFWQLKNGVKKIGLAIHRLSNKFDSGAVVWYKETENKPFFNYKHVEQLFSQLCVEGAFFLLRLTMHNLPVLEINRSNILPSYQAKPKLEDVLIRWEKMDAEAVCNLTRACNPWNKGATTILNGMEVKILDARSLRESTNSPPGTILSIGDSLKIACYNAEVISTTMLFIHDCYYPAYFIKHIGISEMMQFSTSPINVSIV